MRTRIAVAALVGVAMIFHAAADADAQLFKRRAARKAARQVQIPSSVPRTQCVDADGDGLDDRTGQPCGPATGAGPVTREEFGGRPGYIDPGTGTIVGAPPTTIRAQHVDANGDGICDGCGAALSAETSSVPVKDEPLPLDAAISAEANAKAALDLAVRQRKIAAIKRQSELDQQRIALEAERKTAALERGETLSDVKAQQIQVQSLEPTPDELPETPDDCEDCELGE